jgi:hypothetical protein
MNAGITRNTRDGGWRGRHLRLAAWGAAAALLLTPLVAMRFTDEVVWTPFDFAFAAVLIGSVGIGLELAMRLGPNGLYRAGAATALGTGFLMIWINAAVSIVGGDDSPAGPLFLAVPIVALAGAALARLKAAGMARAMVATAAAQVAVPVFAQLAGLGVSSFEDIAKVAVLTAGFAAMWLGAGWLFARAGRT